MTPNRRQTDNYEPATPFEALVLEKLSNVEEKADKLDRSLFGDIGIERRVRTIEIRQGWWAGAAVGLSTALSWFISKR